MTATALSLVLALLASQAPPPQAARGEPLPAGAPTDEYELAGWCYGAMSEYLEVYDRVKPDLRAIDKTFGTSAPNEKEPYSADMAAARDELKVLAGAVEAAEKASPRPIAPQGVAAVKLGRSIWTPAEEKTRRELARAWLSWAMPDRCDSAARALTAKSALLGQALQYNTSATPVAMPPPAPAAAPIESTPAPAPARAAPPPTSTQSILPDPNGPLPDPVTPGSDR